MLMEQEAPLLFHTVFTGSVILAVGYLLHWRSHSPQKKPLELILYFVLLQIPAYILIFYAMMCPRSGDRTFAFGMGGLCWLIGIVVLMQGIRDLLDYNTDKSNRPNEQQYGEEYLKRYSSFFLPHQAVASNTVAYLDKCKPQAVYIWAIYGCLSIFFVKLHQAKPAKALAQCVFISVSLHIQPAPQHGSLYCLTFICLLLSTFRQKRPQSLA